jgi:hypothetical protein
MADISENLLLDDFAVSRGIHCGGCGGSSFEVAGFPFAEPGNNQARLDLTCRACGRSRSTWISYEDLKSWLTSQR